MESRAELQDMTVAELRSFLSRNNVSPHSVRRLDGSDGFPRKSDLAERALEVRDEYDRFLNAGRDSATAEAAAATAPAAAAAAATTTTTSTTTSTPAIAYSSSSSPIAGRRRGQLGLPLVDPKSDDSTIPNPFQQQQQQQKQKRNDARVSVIGDDPPAPPPQTPSVRSPKMSPKTPRTAAAKTAAAARRRSSVGWLDPSLIAQLNSATKSTTPAPPAVLVDDDPPPPAPEKSRPPPPHPESDGDELVLTEDDERWERISSSSGTSVLSDSAGSVDDVPGRHDRFEFMTVPALKNWLAENKVPFLTRSKKATLVSLARAHETHIQASTAASPPQATEREVIAPASSPVSYPGAASSIHGHVSAVALVPVDDFPSQSDSQSRLPVPLVERRASSTGRISRVSPQRKSTRRRTVNRKFITAPAVDIEADDAAVMAIDVDFDEGTRDRSFSEKPLHACRELDPNVKAGSDPGSNVTRRAKPEQAVSSSFMEKYRRGRRSIADRLSYDAAYLRRRLPTLTPRALMIFSLVALLVILSFSLLNYWRALRRPFCPNDVSEYIMEDGRECQPCPVQGSCVGGHLQCNPGYRRVNNRCPEDQEVSLYAEHLASRAGAILRELAGRAECGENVPVQLTYVELRDALAPRDQDSQTATGEKTNSYNRRRVRSCDRFDETKFMPAFSKAIVLLHGSDAYGVVQSTDGYRATQAQLPLSCATRRFVLRNWRYVCGILAAVTVWTYISIRRRIHAAKRQRIASICDTARQFLLEQSTAYRDELASNPFIIDTQLRDEIVGHSRHAIQLWKEAEKLLARDTRVQKTGPVTVNGHPCYHWEWRGRASLGAGGTGGRSSFGSGSGIAHRPRPSPARSEDVFGDHDTPGPFLDDNTSQQEELRRYSAGRYPWHGFRISQR